jgi:3-deoxy-D-manno-octulosonic acid (KDO) 8-phosphate synthase
LIKEQEMSVERTPLDTALTVGTITPVYTLRQAGEWLFGMATRYNANIINNTATNWGKYVEDAARDNQSSKQTFRGKFLDPKVEIIEARKAGRSIHLVADVHATMATPDGRVIGQVVVQISP